MEWGIAINLREPVSEIIEKAVIADRGGIDTIWVTDFPATRCSPVLASVIAKNTSNCRIGVGLLSPFIYSPSHIVQMLSTLIESHGARFDLLLGPGDRTKLEEIGISYGDISTLVERMTTAVCTIQEGLSEYKDCRIFVGAQGPKMIKASTHSNGVLLNYSDPEMIQWAKSILVERPAEFVIGVFPPSMIGSSKVCEENMSIKVSAAVVALGLSPSIMKRFGLKKNLQPAIEQVRMHGLTNQITEMIDQKILNKFCLCGSVESNSKCLESYQEIGIDMVVYGPPQGASLKGVENLVKAKNFDKMLS